ncbi:MAG: hypothetical protein ACON4Z_17810 [Planctomycetota bacterium]
MVDQARRRSEPAQGRWVARAAALATVSFWSCCALGPPLGDDPEVLPSWRAQLAAVGRVCARELGPALSLSALPAGATVVVVDPSERPPRGSPDAASRRALRRFVERGGRLVLFGHAARMASELGVEPERPESDVYRWGYDRRAVSGRAALALHFVSGREPSLYEGLRGTVTEHSIPVVAGAPCSAPLCTWRAGSPSAGEVLARLGEVQDDAPAPLGAPVLVRWRCGAGAVLACGLLPQLDHPDEVIRANARGFARRCASWGTTASRDLVLLKVAPRATEPSVGASPSERGPPIVPLLAHWGWQASLHDGEDASSERSVADLVADALAPSHRQGADVFELALTEAGRGSALVWDAEDPIAPPASWRSSASRSAWTGGDFRDLAIEAHERGLLLLGGFDPLPVGDRWEERLVALRRHARDLAGWRRLGASAFDGFGLREWFPDARGFGVAGVQDYHPGAALYCAGERAPAFGGALRAMDADDGGLRGLRLAGLADSWRDGFPGDRFPLGVLDARARPDRFPGGGVRGGSSHPDWLVRQFHDFTRARRLAGGTALWRRHDPRTLGPQTAAYVQGLSMEPLRAAVAMPLAATGRDGLRAAAAGLFDQPPRGFGATVDAPAAAHVLQNNWVRLLGSGGPLAFDPRGLADFDSGSVTLSPGLLRTRLSGGRPDGSETVGTRVALTGAARRGPGDYRALERVVVSASASPRVPRTLALDAAPAWPAAVDFAWQTPAGYHELSLTLRAERGDSVVAVWLDDVLLRAVPVRSRAPEQIAVVPVHVARAGRRTLRIEVTEGDAVALVAAEIERVGDVGVEASVAVPAGSFAQLVEHSTSSHHEERLTLSMMADTPGFVVHAQCLRAARGLQRERRFSLPGYDVLPALAGGAAGERRALVLTSRHQGVPDLCVVPLQLSRYERLEFADGELVWSGAAATGHASRVGFLLRPQGEGAQRIADLPRLVEQLDCPLQVDLGPDGRASLTSDLPVACSRLVELDTDAAQPLLVRERGYWTWRPVQPAPGGGVWARIHQEPGDVVEVLAGPQVAARTRPGAGALRCVALTDCAPDAATAVVLQRSRLRAPSVEMAADFDEVTVDGQPWAWFDGRTVYLPDVPGRYRVETRTFTGAASPHVRLTGAPLRRCAYDPAADELTLVTAGDDARPAGLPWTAVVEGPAPVAVLNGEVVDVAELHLPSAAAEAAAARGGTLIRFRPGTTVLKFGARAAAPGR